MSVIESYQKFSKERVRLKELVDLRDESYKIIQFPTFYSLKVMEEIIATKWEVLFNKLNMFSSYQKMKELLDNMKEGRVNRQQFAQKASCEFATINSRIDAIQEIVETSAKDFSTAYNDFCSKGLSEEKDLGKRLVYYTLMQPESKEIIMEFLKL